MMRLYYQHKTRTIVDDLENPIGFSQAKALVNSGEASDWNIAFERLMDANFNADQVDAEYAEIERIAQAQDQQDKAQLQEDFDCKQQADSLES